MRSRLPWPPPCPAPAQWVALAHSMLSLIRHCQVTRPAPTSNNVTMRGRIIWKQKYFKVQCRYYYLIIYSRISDFYHQWRRLTFFHHVFAMITCIASFEHFVLFAIFSPSVKLSSGCPWCWSWSRWSSSWAACPGSSSWCTTSSSSTLSGGGNQGRYLGGYTYF